MHARENVGGVKVGVTASGKVHTTGVKRCASVAACPVCAPPIREARGQLQDAILTRALAAGCLVYFVTETVSHAFTTPLDETMAVLQDCHSHTFSGTRVSEKRTGYLGQLRAWDYTHTANGWHPHFHTCVVFAAGTSPVAAMSHLQKLGTVFAQRARDKHGRNVLQGKGWNVQRVVENTGAASYGAKIDGGWSAALEMTRVDLKTESVTPWTLLRVAVAGDHYAGVLWREYEVATAGRRQILTGAKLNAMFGAGYEPTDDELAAAAPDEPLIYEVVYDVALWTSMRNSGRLGDLYDGFRRHAEMLRLAAEPDQLRDG